MVITHHYLWPLLFVSKFKSSCHGHHNSCQLAKLQFKRRRIVEIQHGRVSWRWAWPWHPKPRWSGGKPWDMRGESGQECLEMSILNFSFFFLRVMNDWDEQWDVDSLSQAGQKPAEKKQTLDLVGQLGFRHCLPGFVCSVEIVIRGLIVIP